MSDRALLVSIDGVAPRFVTPVVMPNLIALARAGASCFTARTVLPSLTLPAHLSMLAGVAPSTHGVPTNTPAAISGTQSTVLAVARRSGLQTSAVHTWQPLDSIFEKDATDRRVVIGDGYDPADDDQVVAEGIAAMGAGAELCFTYVGGPDLVGHDHGWGSDQYLDALADADRRLGRLLAAAGDRHIVVTTDHGGTGRDHAAGGPTDIETFVVARSPRLHAGSAWASASILDVAPTLADLLGLPPDPAWEGRSLVGAEEPLVDVVMALLAAGADVRYGERVTMLEHALQTAAVAEASGADDALVLAALLHDIGHVLGDAGAWGLPGHAEVGARALQPLLHPDVVEPIRLHVDAKRWLVATDDSYAAQLSEASTESLAEQGGPFDDAEAAAFDASAGAARAVALRRWDDDGKVVGLEIADLESHRDRIARAIAPPTTRSAAWYRDACRCPACRDAGNDQHLLDVTDVGGWRVEAAWQEGDDLLADLVHADGRQHRCVVPPAPVDTGPRHWGADDAHALLADAADFERGDWTEQVSAAVARDGIAVIRNVPTEPGTVLDVGRTLGFVRETNYGDLFDVIARPDPANLADTAVGLPLHTDNPYRDPCPTVQLLHCLRSDGDGGASRFSDGLAGAERLRHLHPHLFDRLASTPVLFRYHGDGGDLRARRPLIDVAPDGEVRGVAVNHRSMEAPDLDDASVDEFYEAYAAFVEILDAPDAVAELTMGPGDLVVFDNRRVLHGRTAFEVTGPRHLQGCYIDIDALYSRTRVAG